MKSRAGEIRLALDKGRDFLPLVHFLGVEGGRGRRRKGEVITKPIARPPDSAVDGRPFGFDKASPAAGLSYAG